VRFAKRVRLTAIALLVATASCTGDGSSVSSTAEPTTSVASTTTTAVPDTTTPAPTTEAPTTTSVAEAATITRPVVDPSICAPVSARASNFAGHTLNLFAISREAPIPIQIIGNPAGDSYGAFALVERFFASDFISGGGDTIEINGNQVRIGVYGNGNGNARWMLPDGSIAYVRSRGLDRAALEAIVERLSPRDKSAAIPGFDFDDSSATPELALLHEHLNTGLSGRISSVECVNPVTGFGYQISALDADPIVEYGSVIDRPVPLEVGVRDGTLIVISGPADPTAPTIADVVNTDVDTWATLLAATPVPADLLAGWPPSPATVPDVADVPLLFPSAIPAEMVPLTRAEGDDDPTDLVEYSQFWFGNGPDAVVLSIDTYLWQAPPADEEVIDIAGWDRASFVPMSSGYTHLWLGSPSGSVSLWAHGLGRDDVAMIAASLGRRGPGLPGWDVGNMPDRLTLVHEGWNLGAASRTIRSTGEPRFEMSIVHGVPSVITTPFGFATTIDLLDINGATGVAWAIEGRAAVTWSVGPDLTVVLGYGGPLETAIELARSVEPVDKATWNATTTPDPSTDDGCNSMFC
jgi:hypothetical protein